MGVKAQYVKAGEEPRALSYLEHLNESYAQV
jgi:hypothetical protein